MNNAMVSAVDTVILDWICAHDAAFAMLIGRLLRTPERRGVAVDLMRRYAQYHQARS